MPSTTPDLKVSAREVQSASKEDLDPIPIGRHSYSQILKSSVLIGGSSAFNIAIGIVRTKIMAVLLGPSGFGLMGLYTSIMNLTQAVVGMGIHSSGVRQIAAAAGSPDTGCIAQTVTVLRRTSVAVGLLGALLLLVLSNSVSTFTFGSGDHTYSIALLSLAVFFRTVSDGQSAMLQGLRRISDLARSGMLGSVLGAAISIVLVYLFRERGLVPSLVVIAGTTLLLSWWFSRRVSLDTATIMSTSQVSREAGALLKLGFAFMASGLFTMGAAYLVRMIIVRQVGFEAAGLYQSAWTIGGLYVGFILQAMAADFYPRLAAVVRNHEECNRLVNEQAEIGLLLAGPGIIATLTLAPFVISLLYTSAFREAVEILRWICLGAALQVITWPMGFIIVAAGKQRIFFWTEFVYTVLYLGVAWVFVRYEGVNGAGMAFFASYVLHGLMIYPVVRWLTGFRWSPVNRRRATFFLTLIGIVFSSFYLLPVWPATILGTLAALLNAVYSTRVLASLVSVHRLPRFIQRFFVSNRLAPQGNS